MPLKTHAPLCPPPSRILTERDLVDRARSLEVRGYRRMSRAELVRVVERVEKTQRRAWAV